MENRRTGRTEGGQAAPLAALAGLAALGVELALVPAFCILRRSGCSVWTAVLSLLLSCLAGAVCYHSWRRHGGLKNYSSFKLFLAGTVALTVSGPLVALCSVGGFLVMVPMFFVGACAAGFWEAVRQIFYSFGEFVQIFPEEKGTLCLGLVLWAAALVGAFCGLAVGAVPIWVLRTVMALCPGACTLLAEGVLARRCCLSDQRGLELKRERILKEI